MVDTVPLPTKLGGDVPSTTMGLYCFDDRIGSIVQRLVENVFSFAHDAMSMPSIHEEVGPVSSHRVVALTQHEQSLCNHLHLALPALDPLHHL